MRRRRETVTRFPCGRRRSIPVPRSHCGRLPPCKMTSHRACAHARTCILLCVHRPSAFALISCSFLICRRHFACRVRRVLRGSGVIKVFFFSSPFPVRFVWSCAVLHSVRARRSQTVASVGGISWSQVFLPLPDRNSVPKDLPVETRRRERTRWVRRRRRAGGHIYFPLAVLQPSPSYPWARGSPWPLSAHRWRTYVLVAVTRRYFSGTSACKRRRGQLVTRTSLTVHILLSS